MSGLRQRKSIIKTVTELDAFPKVPDDYKQTTVSGGGVSILVFVAIAWLVFSEVMYYSATDLKFEYDVDTDVDQKLKINIDITVAMKCEWIGADILDLTGQRADTFGTLNEEPVVYELSPEQQQHFDMTRNLNDYIREEYHAIHKLLWRTGFMGKNSHMPKRKNDDEPKNGCRLHGSLTVNKVAGNFHITAGKSIPVFPRGHAHLAMMVKDSDYNYSHRVDHLSFGDDTPGIISPLDSEMKSVPSNYHMFQYFIQVVPTRVSTLMTSLDTYQYAYTEHDRTINHAAGSHGVPGIFVKYDISSLKVTVKEERQPFWQFLVRLCGIVGGIFATSGMLHTLVGVFTDIVCCRFKLGKYAKETNSLRNSDDKTPNPTISNSNSSTNIAATVPLPENQQLNSNTPAGGPSNILYDNTAMIQNPLLNNLS